MIARYLSSLSSAFLAILAIGFMGFAPKAFSATMLIDFGNSTHITTGQPETWNNFVFNTADSSMALRDTFNNLTGVTLTLNHTMSFLTENHIPTDPTPYPDSATRDGLFNPTVGTMTFSGLDSSLTYNVTIYGYIRRLESNPSRLTRVTINGVTQSYEPGNTVTNPSGGYTTFYGVSPTGTSLDLSFATSNGNYIISVIELTAVPEPSKVLLFGLGAGLCCLRRCRRSA